jgi:septal ring factor EnvC (AmiA/AmiB activator)
VALLASVWVCAAEDDLEDSRRRLEELERRIGEAARSLEEKQSSIRGIVADLQAVEQEESRIRRRMAALSRETVSLEERLAARTAEMEELKGRIARSEVQVRHRLAVLYKGGEAGALRLLFAADSPARAAEDQDFLRRIVRRDRELIAEFRGDLAAQEDLARQLAELHAQRQGALENLRQDQDSLRRALRLKGNLLARAKRDESELGRELKELRERAARLESLVKKLESGKGRKYTPTDGPFASQRGRLPWPVAGEVRVGFGRSRHAQLATLHESQGIEIAVVDERPITAVWPGRVLFAAPFRGFGQLLILDHGDGYYTLYAQASRLVRKVGDQVGGGEILAYSGHEGARGVYFEIRHHGIPLDPADWLAAR